MLLNELKEFSFERHRWNATPEKCKVANLPISEIGLALSRWILSFFAESFHPLMPSYALDTARFLQFHVEGHYGYDDEPWYIKPVVEVPRGERELIRFLDARFKRDFTQRMGTLHLCGTVPQNCTIVGWNGEQTLSADAEFLFNTERCHLSSGIYDHTQLTYKVAGDQKYDLHDEFRFMGAVFVVGNSKPLKFATKQSLSDYPDLDLYGLKVELPAHWIDGAVDLPDPYSDDRTSKPKIVNAPYWEAELD